MRRFNMVNGPMGGNMGTPPVAPQPPQVSFTTTAESRGGFNNFLKSIPATTNMIPPTPPMGSPQMMPPMGGNPMGNIDIFNQPPMMQPPMQQPMMMADGGMAGNPLSGYGDYLSQQIDSTQVEPFIQQVQEMASDRFNLDRSQSLGGGMNANPSQSTGQGQNQFGSMTGNFNDPNKINVFTQGQSIGPNNPVGYRNPQMQQPIRQPSMRGQSPMGGIGSPFGSSLGGLRGFAEGGNVDKNDIGVDNFADKNGGIVDGLPRMWKSSPDQPMTYLSYITGEEQNFLRQSNIHEKDDPNRIGQPGPKGVPSFDDPGGDTEDEGSDYSEAPSDDNDGNESYSNDAQATDPNIDDSPPDDDMDYTDEDYGYTTISGPPGPEGPQSDMDRATQIGQDQAATNATNANNTDRSPGRLTAVFGPNIGSALGGLTVNEVMGLANITDPSQTGTIDYDPNSSKSKESQISDMVSDITGLTGSNVQAAANTGFSNYGPPSLDDLGLSLEGVGLGPSMTSNYSMDTTPSIASVSPTSGPNTNADITGFGSSRDKSDFSTDIDALSGKQEDAKKGTFFRNPQNPITAAINALSKIGPNATISNIAKGYAPTYGPDGQITGTTDYGIGMGQPDNDKDMSGGNIFSSGRSVPGYDVFDATQPSVNDDTQDMSGNESDPLILLRKKLKAKEEEDKKDISPGIFGGVSADPVSSGPLVVDSPFTSGVGDYNPVGYDAGDLNALIARLTGIAAPQSMAQGGIAGYAGGGVDQALDRFLASA